MLGRKQNYNIDNENDDLVEVSESRFQTIPIFTFDLFFLLDPLCENMMAEGDILGSQA